MRAAENGIFFAISYHFHILYGYSIINNITTKSEFIIIIRLWTMNHAHVSHLFGFRIAFCSFFVHSLFIFFFFFSFSSFAFRWIFALLSPHFVNKISAHFWQLIHRIVFFLSYSNEGCSLFLPFFVAAQFFDVNQNLQQRKKSKKKNNANFIVYHRIHVL